MAGCKYSNPTEEDVITEMKEAFRTLDCYLETPDGMTEKIPDIYYQLLEYINK